MKEIKITVTDYTIEMLLHGITLLADGMRRESFDGTIRGVLTEDKSKSEGDNAQAWITNHYDSACAAFTLIAASSEIISNALTNGELEIVIK